MKMNEAEKEREIFRLLFSFSSPLSRSRINCLEGEEASTGHRTHTQPTGASACRNSECITASYCTQVKNGRSFSTRYQDLPFCAMHLSLSASSALLSLPSRWLYTSIGSTMYILVSRFFIVLKSDYHPLLYAPCSLASPPFNYSSVN